MNKYLKEKIQNIIKRSGYQIVKMNAVKQMVDSGNLTDKQVLKKLCISQVTFLLNSINHYEDKMSLLKNYYLEKVSGCYFLNETILNRRENNFWYILSKYNLLDVDFLNKLNTLSFFSKKPDESVKFEKINYGCGDKLMKGWLNVDINDRSDENYLRMHLIEKHPFKNESFNFGYSEDVVEHFSQSDSIIFLSETYRTLKKGGVLRLSFPSLEGVLSKHYDIRQPFYYVTGKVEAYLYWDHLHFYSQEEIQCVAKYVGFREIEFVEYGKSRYAELNDLDTRAHQIGLNIYVELTK